MKLLNSIILIISCAAFTLAIIVFCNSKKMVYVDTNLLFVGFKMTTEQDIEIKKIEEKKQTVMDSLLTQLKNVQTGLIKLEEQQLTLLKKDYMNKSARFSEEIKKLKQATTDKIWKQINQYVTEYGKENNIDIIFGANGQGSLMYAKENVNHTEVVIKYINEKYSGAK